MPIEIKLPSLGEEVPSGDVLEVKVREGDVIKKDQGILELETEKATVEVPSTHAGKVLKVHVKDGQTITTGAPLITLEEVAGPAAAPRPAAAPTSDAGTPSRETPPAPASSRPAPKPAEPSAERAAPVAPAAKAPAAPTAPAAKAPPAPTAKGSAAPAAAPGSHAEPAPQSDSDQANGSEAASEVIPAGPSVRRFAREVGVDLASVAGSGPGGRITREDVVSVVRTANEVARSRVGTAPDSRAPAMEPTEVDAWGPIRVEKMTRIRKTIATKMAESSAATARVTNFDDADVTELERIRLASKADYAADGVKLTTLPFVIKAVAMSLKKHPAINAAIDLANEQIIYKNYVNIGIAVDSERGLVVPSLRNTDKLSISEIARQLSGLAESVRGGSFSLDDLRGSTFTISNLGAVGGTYSTPMINVPEVAILLIGRSRKVPVVTDDDKIIGRLMMPLSLSYDHRLVDGAAAARFLNDVIGYLEAPSRLLMAL